MTAKTFFCILSIFLFTLSAAGGQTPDSKRDRTWVIGRIGVGIRNVLDFQTSPPVLTEVGSSLSMQDMGASVCDTAGQLLFYTNGFRIMNRDHLLMENGDSLNCCLGYFQNGMNTGFGAFQGALILPAPGNGTLYYAFTANADIATVPPYLEHTSTIYYSVVDMAQGGGLGRVVQKNVPLIQDTLNMGMLNACRHANGRDWWMLVREYASNRYHRFLLTPSGIQEGGVQSVGSPIPQHTFGQTAFSPDGAYFAFAQAALGYAGLHYYGYGFDRCTGLLHNPVSGFIVDTMMTVGLAFSPNSNFLYISTPRHLWQLDVKSPDWESSRTLIAVQQPSWQDSAGNGYALGMMQLAPDNKIYMHGGNGGMYLNVISQPDSAGTACNFLPHSFPITAHNGRCMPNFPHFRLGALAGSGCDTLQQVGVSAAGGAEPIKIYPNPTQDKLHIANAPPHCVAVMYDLLGRERLRVAVTNDEIEVGSLAEGVYVLRLENAGKTVALQKLIIQR